MPVVSLKQFTRLPELRQRLEEAIIRVSLTSEAARREVLIAPILLEVAHITEVTQDLMLYRVPTDLEVLMQILVKILTQN